MGRTAGPLVKFIKLALKKGPLTSKQLIEDVIKIQGRRNYPKIAGRKEIWNALHNNCHQGGLFKLSSQSNPEEHKRATYELQ